MVEFFANPAMIQIIGFFIFTSVLTCGFALIAMIYCIYIRDTQKKMYTAMLRRDQSIVRHLIKIYEIYRKNSKNEEELTTKRES